jgi:class 3 adenylate cyclase
VWLVCETGHQGRCTFIGACTAVVIGLVAITPGAFFVSPMSAIGVGGITKTQNAKHLGEYLDDTLDVFACHGLSGFLGTALTGLFADESVGGYPGAVNGNWKQFGYQLAGATVSAVYSFGVSAVLLFALRYTIGVRVSEEDEALGLDHTHETGGRDNSKAPRNEEAPIAFIFTDIEKSTKLWSRSHVLMSRLMDIHNKVIRTVIQKHEMYEVKTVGDAFLIAGTCPAKALRCAFDIQLGLYEAKWDAPELDALYTKWRAAEARQAENEGDSSFSESATTLVETKSAKSMGEASIVIANKQWNGLRVRIGLHFGESEVMFDQVTKGYDYRGAAIAVAARVEAAAHGGQVLATHSMWQAAKAVDSTITDGIAVMNMGETRLRGFRDPFAILQLMPVALASRRFPLPRLGKKAAPLKRHESVLQPLEEGDDILDFDVKIENFSLSNRRSSLSMERSVSRATSNARSHHNFGTSHPTVVETIDVR